MATRRLFKDVRGSLDDPTRLWATVKRFRTTADQGSLPVDTLVHHFCAVFNRASDPVPVVFCGSFPVEDDLLDALFTSSELDRAVSDLSRGTAPGTTGVGNDILLALYELPGGPEFFLSLFNACLEGASLLAVWRCTEIFLLYKGKGLISDPGSYRGIALMDSSLKLYERLLYSRLSAWSHARDLIPPCQFGFRAAAGTLDAIFVFTTLVFKYVGIKRGALFVALIDFQKAFPSVNRALLIDKLGRLGVSDKFRRCLCAIFEKNTFALRSGNHVTAEFPVTTGLREGSVLSPLLFSLFISDMVTEVLRPYSPGEFLKTDPSLNGLPIPGLLYADDLVLFCLSADLLRDRLRRLGAYALHNELTVNVSKCEIVVFGSRGTGHGAFRYEGQLVPMRSTCKYLGVWLDADRSGRTLRNAVLEKFRGAVPVFFGLCRSLRVGDVQHVFFLAQALLFSLLYGAEFVGCLDVIRRCETFWWKGVRQFYGLPSGVSGVTLQLIFPEFSLVGKVLLGKISLFLRGLQNLPTLLPEALVYDRGFLFDKHRVGFTQVVKDWGQQLDLPDIHICTSKAEATSMLEALHARGLESAWDQFARMPSTQGFASMLRGRDDMFWATLAASRFSRLGVRVFLLAITGNLAQSYLKSRMCPSCGVKFDFEHFLSCKELGPDISARLSASCKEQLWGDVVASIFLRFQTFIHYFRGGHCDADESDLFELVCAMSDQEVE